MANKMLIDSSHPEETRVVVVRGQKVEEFDFESASRRQLRGNIYLAKVTRVEPSLQAAFVEYGGNRHGFLAFSEIHPDYYQIPVADRQALLAEDIRAEQDRDDESKSNKKHSRPKNAENGETTTSDDDTDGDDESEEIVEQLGGDALEEVPERPRHSRRQYKIQEVIKRRQILLVQVVKEERGNKGAALTTYLSLAGRYSVLMPNTGRGGGISRKITNAQDRKRLKEIAQDLEVPDGMGIILRTAGASRTRAEIKRDYEYLMRMWESVRELTIGSSAPALVYEEGSLIKRAIRDLYNKDIDEVLVSGDDGYREAKDFMRMLMPSHAKAVKPYRDILPLFSRHGVEAQLDAMFSNHVTLKSGGYLVISPTEALVSIDVNSGRSTREHNIEDTALRTNLEAAEEISRQLRLRDLAGLVVIDFIDMEEKRNNRAVEKRLNECLKNDRARIQVGRISLFGLLEMSRQRIRTGVLESSSISCPHCTGTGFVRATPSVALHILRSVEETLIKSASHNVIIRTRSEVAFYILNQKRAHLRELEMRFGVEISVNADDTLSGAVNFVIERGEPAINGGIQLPPPSAFRAEEVVAPVVEVEPVEDDEPEEEDVAQEAAQGESGPDHSHDANDDNSENGRKRRRRRRRGRGRNGERSEGSFADHSQQHSPAEAAGPEETSAEAEVEEAHEAHAGDEADAREDRGSRQRRSRRGGRGRGRNESFQPETTPDQAFDSEPAIADAPVAEAAPAIETDPVEEPKKGRARSRKPAKAESVIAEVSPAVEEGAEAEKPKRRRRTAKSEAADVAEAETVAPIKPVRARKAAAAKPSKEKEVAPVEQVEVVEKQPEQIHSAPVAEPISVVLTPADPDRPKRAGWWSRGSK